MAGRKAVLLVLVVLFSTCAGCRAVGNYFGNRANDLADIVMLELTAGPGIDVHAQVTALLGGVLGWSQQDGLMWDSRYFGRARRVSGGLLIEGETHIERTVYASMEPLYGEQPWVPRGSYWVMFLPVGQRPDTEYKFRWYRALDVEVGASAILGLHIGVSPGEVLDFVTSIFFLDIAGDDYHPERDEDGGDE